MLGLSDLCLQCILRTFVDKVADRLLGCAPGYYNLEILMFRIPTGL